MYFKPMLAEHAVLETIKYPVLCSTKLDGVRCINFRGSAYSRSLKLIPNKYIQCRFKELSELPKLDGELIVGEPTSEQCFRNTTSGVMKEIGKPEFKFYVFDVIPEKDRLENVYTQRLTPELIKKLKDIDFIVIVPQVEIRNSQELFDYERMVIEEGYEGVMIRHDLPYKFGRSTNREGILLKLKRYADSEAEIIKALPLLSNQNEMKRDALGKIDRSNKKEGMVAKELLGSLTVRDLITKVEFSVGSGFTEEERINLWNRRFWLAGDIIKYKYFPVGQKEAPRHPVFLGFRKKEDM